MHRMLQMLPTLTLLCAVALAQESAPVTVDASPTATELLRRAEESVATNPAEAARVVQEALEKFPHKLVPWPPIQDRFRSAQAAAYAFLRATPTVLERWLREQSPIAQRELQEGRLREVVAARELTPAGLQAECQLAQHSMDEGHAEEAIAWIDRALRHPSIDAKTQAKLQRVREMIAPAPALFQALAPVATTVTEIISAQSAWQPLWSRELPTAWLARRVADIDPHIAQRTRDQLLSDGSSLVAAPRFEGDALLLADGSQVQAFDRFSGSVLWKSAAGNAVDRTPGPIGDLCVAAADSDVVIVLPGHALPEQRSNPSRILALERTSGRRLWELRLDQSQRVEFEDLFPHGEPLIMGDLVIVQGRKSNARLESAAWLLALDRMTGVIRWNISIGAAGGVRLAASRPLNSPTRLQAEDVVAATSLGVVTRIDAVSGEIRWLRRWPPPIREPRISTPAWQLPTPVADSTLIAWIAPDGISLIGLDPSDGSTLWTLPIGVGTQIGAVRTLLLDAQHIYAIGDDVVAIDRLQPNKIAWKLSEKLPSPALLIRGEVALGTLADGARALVVPTQTQLVLLQPQSGAIIGEFALDGGGNTCLQRGQLAIAGPTRLTLAMPADVGEKLLRERLAQSPDDPRRGLALVELGRAWHRATLVLDGAKASQAALQAITTTESESIRGEIVTRLLDRTLLTSLQSTEADSIIAFAGVMAKSPQQRAAVLLCVGQQAALRGHALEATQSWMKVWLDPQLRSAMIAIEPQWQINAGSLALSRLAHSATDHAEVFVSALRQLTAVGADPAALLEALREVMQLAPDPSQLQHIATSVRASAALAAFPAVSHATSALLQGDPQPVRPPIGALQSRAITLPGMLAKQSNEAIIERPLRTVLLVEPTALSLHRGEQLAQAWRLPYMDREPIVASWSPHLVIYSAAGRDDGSVTALDALTGATRFRIDRVKELFQPAPMPALSMDAIESVAHHSITCLRAGEFLLLLRGDSKMIALRLDGDGKVAWRGGESLRTVEASDSNAWGVAFVGAPLDGSDTTLHITILHALDGAPWLQAAWPNEIGSPQWIRLLPQGLLLAGEEGVAMLSLAPTLPVRWMNTDRRVRSCEERFTIAPWVIVKDKSSESLTAIALADGSIQSAFLSLPSLAPSDGVASVERVDNMLLTLRMARVAQHAIDGLLQGIDAVAVEHRFDQFTVTQDSVVVADFGDREIQLAENQPSAILLRQFSLQQGLRSIAAPVAVRLLGARLESLDAVNDWVLLGCDDRTFAVPAPMQQPEIDPR